MNFIFISRTFVKAFTRICISFPLWSLVTFRKTVLMNSYYRRKWNLYESKWWLRLERSSKKSGNFANENASKAFFNFFFSNKCIPFINPATIIENFVVYDPPFASVERIEIHEPSVDFIPIEMHAVGIGRASTLKIMERGHRCPPTHPPTHPSLEAGHRRCIYRRPFCTAIVGQIPRQWPPSYREVEWWRAEWWRRLRGLCARRKRDGACSFIKHRNPSS